VSPVVNLRYEWPPGRLLRMILYSGMPPTASAWALGDLVRLVLGLARTISVAIFWYLRREIRTVPPTSLNTGFPRTYSRRPGLREIISAMMLKAISSGVSARMSRPAGTRTVPSFSAGSPLRSRLRRIS
jgi:hypothetical protein